MFPCIFWYAPSNTIIDVSKEAGWRCPGCRTPSSVVPSVYKCFCGKMVDPLWTPSNKFQVPHSCGELCGKRLATEKSMACMHKCRLLCHPGPCPPCPVTVSTYCPCGKKPYPYPLYMCACLHVSVCVCVRARARLFMCVTVYNIVSQPLVSKNNFSLQLEGLICLRFYQRLIS